MRLTNLTWPKAQEYFEKNDMVLISIGSIECHGRHMPLGTDTLIPEHLLEKIEKKSDVLIAPTIPYGSCQCLAPYPGTIDIDNEVLYQFCRQIFLSLYRHGARKFVFLNGNRLSSDYQTGAKTGVHHLSHSYQLKTDQFQESQLFPHHRRGRLSTPGSYPMPSAIRMMRTPSR